MLITVSQTTDVFAFELMIDDGGGPVTCVDDDPLCDDPASNTIPGLLSVQGANTVCDIGLSGVIAATKTFIGNSVMLETDMDLDCISNAGDLGTFTYSQSETGFQGDSIICTTTGGGNTGLIGNTNVKFWVSSTDTHFAKDILLFDVTSDNLGNINWSGQVAAALTGGLYSYTMESTTAHNNLPSTSGQITTYDLKVKCDSVVGGELLPISTQSLMLGGLGMSLTWLVPVVATAGGAAAYIVYRRI